MELCTDDANIGLKVTSHVFKPAPTHNIVSISTSALPSAHQYHLFSPQLIDGKSNSILKENDSTTLYTIEQSQVAKLKSYSAHHLDIDKSSKLGKCINSKCTSQFSHINIQIEPLLSEFKHILALDLVGTLVKYRDPTKYESSSELNLKLRPCLQAFLQALSPYYIIIVKQ